MKWIKKGLIFRPDGEFDWMNTYAQVPTPIVLKDRIRIYFTTRGLPEVNGSFISNTSFIDVALDKPKTVLYVHNKPVIELGKLGTFDEFGIMPGFVQYSNSEIVMYYTGWTRMISVPYCTRIGKAISIDNGNSFEKVKNGLFLGLAPNDPFLINGPFLYQNNEMHHIWYASGKSWKLSKGRKEIVYLIKHSSSYDGIKWLREDDFCIPTLIDDEVQNRPSIIYLEDVYYMFFSYRKSVNFRNDKNAGYRLGVAKSYDLKNWKRIDNELNLELSDYGWDSEMIAYPYPLKVNNKIYLFYNGNYFGRDGFGYAVLQ